MASEPVPEKKRTADRLAMTVVILSAALIAVLSGLAIAFAGEKASTAKDVLNTVLPLIASWVGTVLAYYYSRENLNTATRNATEMAQQLSGAEKLQILRVRDSMIPVDRIDTLKVEDTTPLADIVDFLHKRGRQRLPLFSERGVVRFIVHLSTINAFISQCALEKRPLEGLTFSDLIAEPAHAELLRTSFGVVSESATLAEAKAALEQGRDREDVFITRSGGRDEPVLGWITDNDLVRVSRP
jgi:hypothetical protein